MNRSLLLAGVGVVLLGAGVYVLVGRSAPPPAPVATPSPTPTEPGRPGTVTDEERAAYIAEHVVASDVRLVPDTHVEGDAGVRTVPGLMRVEGTVVNNGPSFVKPVHIRVNLWGEYTPDGGAPEEDVIASYLQEVTGTRPLEPGVPRTFQFTIPEKKAWNGKLTFKLQ